MKKHFLPLVIILAMLIPCSAWAAVGVELDGEAVTFTDSSGYPFVDSADRTQVPFRQTMESFGCAVEWEPVSQTAIAIKRGT